MNTPRPSLFPLGRRLLLVASLALFFSPARAGEALPLDPAVHTGKLANGLTYYIRKNAKPEKRVELRLAVNAGSAQEDDDQRGVAHLVEHMAFRGTKRFPQEEVIHFLQSVGAQFGPDINASTSFDETIYQLSLPSDVTATLDRGLQILADWAGAVTLDDATIDKERNVVLEEWRLGRGANQRMQDQWFPEVFKDSRYAERLPIGTRESIEGASTEAVKRFYRDWYRPDNMAVVVVGDIDPAAIEARIQAEFGSLPAASHPRAHTVSAVPDHQEPRYSIVSDKENTNNIAFLAWKSAPAAKRTTDDLRRELAHGLLFSMFNNRLDELRQKPDAPFLYSASQYGRFIIRSKDAFLLVAVMPDGGVERGIAAALTEAERARQHGFTATELERAKRSLLKGLEQAYNERDKTPSDRLIAEYVAHFLDAQAAPGIEYSYPFAQAQVPTITIDEITPLTGALIKPDNQAVVVMGTEKPGVSLPTKDSLLAVVSQVAAAKIEPYTEKKLAASLLKESPQPGAVTAGKPLPEIGGAELVFANGVRVVLRPTDFQNDEILLRGFRPGGKSIFPLGDKLAAAFAPAYIARAGVGDFSAVELQKMLAGKTVSVNPALDLYADKIEARSSVADLETMLQLVHLYFTQPRQDREAYTAFVTQTQAFLGNLLSRPEVYFQDEAQKFLYQGNPRNPNTLPTAAEWADITFEKTFEASRARFANANGFTFVLVGSFQPQAVVPLLATYLGSLPATKEVANFQDLGLRIVAGPAEKQILKGTDPKSINQLVLSQPAEWSLADAHRFWSLGNIIERILIDTLREEMAGVYTVSVQAQFEKIPYPHSSLVVTIPSAPDNVAKLTAATKAVLERIRRDGPSPEEIQKEAETQRRAFEKDARENSAWLWKLETVYRNGEDFTRLAHPESLVALIESEGLRKIAQVHLDPAKFVQVTLYPEAAGQAAQAAK